MKRTIQIVTDRELYQEWSEREPNAWEELMQDADLPTTRDPEQSADSPYAATCYTHVDE